MKRLSFAVVLTLLSAVTLLSRTRMFSEPNGLGGSFVGGSFVGGSFVNAGLKDWNRLLFSDSSPQSYASSPNTSETISEPRSDTHDSPHDSRY